MHSLSSSTLPKFAVGVCCCARAYRVNIPIDVSSLAQSRSLSLSRVVGRGGWPRAEVQFRKCGFAWAEKRGGRQGTSGVSRARAVPRIVRFLQPSLPFNATNSTAIRTLSLHEEVQVLIIATVASSCKITRMRRPSQAGQAARLPL